MLFSCILLTACGLKSVGSEPDGEEKRFDILADTAQIIEAEENREGDCKFLSMQFFRGEPVQIWAEEMKKQTAR